jgi:hypothetical protein
MFRLGELLVLREVSATLFRMECRLQSNTQGYASINESVAWSRSLLTAIGEFGARPYS